MFKNRFFYLVVLFAICSVVAEDLYAAQPSATSSSRAIISSVTESSPGRYQIIGSVVGADNKPVCGLALASGKCMFSCGPGSLRCEGGTDSLALGQFDLKDLPTETNGMINLQTFVSGLIPGLQVVDPKCGTNCNSGPPSGGLWSGSIIQFFVSPDGTKLTTSGSTIEEGGYPTSLEFSGFNEECAIIRVGFSFDIPIIDDQFSYTGRSKEAFYIYGKFLTSKLSEGTYNYNLSSTCKDTGSWTATLESGASAALRGTPSTNNPPVVEKLYDPETGAYVGEMVIYYK